MAKASDLMPRPSTITAALGLVTDDGEYVGSSEYCTSLHNPSIVTYSVVSHLTNESLAGTFTFGGEELAETDPTAVRNIKNQALSIIVRNGFANFSNTHTLIRKS